MGEVFFLDLNKALFSLLPNGGKLFLYPCIRICCGKSNANSPTAVLLGAGHSMLLTLCQQGFIVRIAYHWANAL